MLTRRPVLGAVAIVALVAASIGGRALLFHLRIRANVWNAGDVLTMLRNYRRDHASYPTTLAELRPYNVTINNSERRKELAQNLSRNSWGQPLIYTSDGVHYTLVSPGRHGYQKAEVVRWRNYEGPHDPDTSLVFKDGDAVELALARWQRGP